MKYLYSILIAILLVLAGSTQTWAQKGKITGRVKDALTGQAIPFANVIIPGTTQGTTTNDLGVYT
ncbi:MAG: carboxypeptidase-like regulatory domain-containing protein, partial [Bacteroidota bacterium]